ncbi:hypothetical protein FO519_003572 [Halicephalobus sp. NKZ332]|nr:hypothetical protein FO519_003572 [Halicephalobus sp. NKZ332]
MSFITGCSVEEKTRYLLSLKPSPCQFAYPVKIRRKQSNRTWQSPYSMANWRERKSSMSSNSSDQSQPSTPSTPISSPESHPTTSQASPQRQNLLRKLIDSISEKLEREELNQYSYLPRDIEELYSTDSQLLQSIAPDGPSDIPADLASIDVSSFRELISKSNNQKVQPSTFN